jgi:hypothetical protein
MKLLLFAFGALVLAIILTGIDRAIMNPAQRPPDKDADGEPDEPNGPAKGL